MSVSESFLPHLVFLPSGIGNLSPFLRLAAAMASRNCRVTFISIQTQAPAFEFSTFFANHPQINLLNLEIIDSNTPSHSTVTDPFIVQIQTINHSLNKLNPFLSSSQVSAIFSDFVLAAALSQISDNLHIPFYIISTTSVRFLSLVSYLPTILSKDPNVLFSNSCDEIEILGLKPIPKSSIPLAWKHEYSTNHLLTAYLLPNAKSLPKVNGVLLNTFHSFEPETIAALNNGIFLKNLPPVFPIGPLQFYGTHKIHDDDHHRHLLPWLSEQRAESVVYVNFGRREVMSADQMRELGKGLEICSYNYLWVMKGNNEEDDEFSDRGVIIRGEVDQEQILANPAIGGFVNQCEWDSVMQAAWNGVPILAWPQHGDQEMNAETVENAELGVWIKEWAPVEKMIEGEEIGQRVAKIMGDLNVKKRAKIVREKAREACEIGGSSEEAFMEVVEILTSKRN
ncbi:hypothetical protein ABFS82_08G027400 [Erythranthe guttata]|uniref:Glycosyltransferase n=1 Tax=Erythranthe guttata TaxID=4155 RepID=A0A022RW08_ERYGU|nr:PREDICTED: anthocyanidin 3-O-glucosyltransferase 2-like [Erythranthe guttata]EYU44156.1 hypothetical protein MIMGU_mgv1a022922mg [Erythranthe guttata]|eukprot:XP_012855183.1 PREDICTED: anthocyanidin 3-O-glucosyltransferase 2-like [Erythranthe guttata]